MKRRWDNWSRWIITLGAAVAIGGVLAGAATSGWEVAAWAGSCVVWVWSPRR